MIAHDLIAEELTAKLRQPSPTLAASIATPVAVETLEASRALLKYAQVTRVSAKVFALADAVRALADRYN